MFDADRVVFARVYQDGSIEGMIDVSHVEKDIEELLQSNENMPAMLCITSRGGLLSEAFGFYERLMIFGGERRRRLDTIALEEVSSAALIIYLMGNKRFVTPHVRLFVHQLSGYYGDNYASIVAHCSEGKLSKSEILNMMTEEGDFYFKRPGDSYGACS